MVHNLGELVDGQRCADSRNNVFTLRIDQEFAEELLGSGRRVAGKCNAGSAIVAHVAEYHRLYVDGGSPVARDVVHAAIENGAVVVPATENGFNSFHQLFARLLREIFPKAVFIEFLIEDDHFFEIVGVEFGIFGNALLFLHFVDDLFKLLFGEFHDDVGEHLDKAAIAVICKALVSGHLRNALDNNVVDSEVEDGVHHSGHRGSRAGTDRNKKRVGGVAKLFLGDLFHFFEIVKNLFLDIVGNLFAVAVIPCACLCRNGKSLRDRHSEIGHFGEVGSFTSEQFAHRSVSLRKQINILLTQSNDPPNYLHNNCIPSLCIIAKKNCEFH